MNKAPAPRVTPPPLRRGYLHASRNAPGYQLLVTARCGPFAPARAPRGFWALTKNIAGHCKEIIDVYLGILGKRREGFNGRAPRYGDRFDIF